MQMDKAIKVKGALEQPHGVTKSPGKKTESVGPPKDTGVHLLSDSKVSFALIKPSSVANRKQKDFSMVFFYMPFYNYFYF